MNNLQHVRLNKLNISIIKKVFIHPAILVGVRKEFLLELLKLLTEGENVGVLGDWCWKLLENEEFILIN